MINQVRWSSAAMNKNADLELWYNTHAGQGLKTDLAFYAYRYKMRRVEIPVWPITSTAALRQLGDKALYLLRQFQ